MTTLALQLAALLLLALGAGLAVRHVAGARTHDGAAASLSITWLAGACALAALAPAMAFAGAPRPAVAAAAWLFAGYGWWRGARRALGAPSRESLLLGALLCIPLAGALVTAATTTLVATDALFVWWPKVDEIASGRVPELHTPTLIHLNPGYPRGMAWLVNLASPWTAPTPATMQVVAWAFSFATALAMAAFARSRGLLRAGALAAATLVVLPDVARSAGLGMTDGALGAAILLAAIGLAERARTPDGDALAMTAGLGAAALKEEGKLVLLVVLVQLALDAWHQRTSRVRLARLAGSMLVLVPFLIAKAGDRATRLDVLPALLHSPDQLLVRIAAVAEHVLRNLVSPCGLTVVACLLLLVPRQWPRHLTTWPALVFLPIVLVVYTGTGAPVAWHVGSTLERLMAQLAPTLLLAASLRCTRSPA